MSASPAASPAPGRALLLRAAGLLAGIALGAAVAAAPLLWVQLGPTLRAYVPWPILLVAAALLAGLVIWTALRLSKRLDLSVANVCCIYLVLAAFCQQAEGLTLGSLDVYEIVLVTTVPLLCLGLLSGAPFVFHQSGLNLLLLAIAAVFVASTALDPNFSGLRIHIKPLITYVLIFQCMAFARATRFYMRAFIIFASINAVFALTQLTIWALTGEFVLIDMDVMGVKYITADTAFGIPLLRPPGFTPHYTALSLVLGFSFCYCLAHVLFGRRWQGRGEKTCFAVCGLLTGVGLVFTQSNSAMMGAGAGAAAIVLVRCGKYLIHLATAGLVGAVLLMVVLHVKSHEPTLVPLARNVLESAKESQQERVNLNREGLEKYVRGGFWVLGRGVGNAGLYNINARRWSAHNGIIVAADEVGVIGLVLCLVIYGWILVRVVNLNVAVRAGPYLPLVRSFIAIYFLFYVREMFEDNYLEGLELAYFAMVETTWMAVRGGAWNGVAAVAPPAPGLASSAATIGPLLRTEGG